jgi:hypothetical protein
MYVYFFQTYLSLPHFFQNPSNRQMFWTISAVIGFPLMLQQRNFTSKVVFTINKNRPKSIEVFDYLIDNDEFQNDQQSMREAIRSKSYL